MKKHLFLLVALLAASMLAAQQPKQITLEDIWASNKFSLRGIQAIRSMADGEHYCTLTRNGIMKFAYATGDTVGMVCNFHTPDSKQAKPLPVFSDYTFSTAGTSMVTLKVTLNNGEMELDSVVFVVTISESKLSFPNAFSPNGDDSNEIFKAKEYQSIIEFHAYIFNRWGQKLYEWTDPAEGWDGTYKGKDVKEGVYFLLCRAKGADGREYNIRKDVNLLRGFLEDGSTNQ